MFQETTEELLEPLDEFLLLEEDLELIDTHHRHGGHLELLFFMSLGVIFELLGITHLVESYIELVEFLSYRVVSENKDLIVGPDVVKRRDEGVAVLAAFVNGTDFIPHIGLDEVLNIFPNIFIDFHFLLNRRLAFLHEGVNKSESVSHTLSAQNGSTVRWSPLEFSGANTV